MRTINLFLQKQVLRGGSVAVLSTRGWISHPDVGALHSTAAAMPNQASLSELTSGRGTSLGAFIISDGSSALLELRHKLAPVNKDSAGITKFGARSHAARLV